MSSKRGFRWVTKVICLAATTALVVFTPSHPAAGSLYWSGAGNWSVGGTGWASSSGGSYTGTWSDGSDAVFEGTASTVTLIATNPTAKSLSFSVTGSITGGTLTMASTGTGIIDTGTFSAAINSAIDGSVGLTKTGSGQLTLSGSSANTYTGLTTVGDGRLVLGKSNNINAIPGDLAISGGAKVTFSATGQQQQIANSAAVTMSGASSALNCTGFNANFRNITETIGSLGVTGGVFHTGVSTWTVDGAASFTGGAGNTIFVGNSGSTSHFGSLSLTNMNAASSGNVAKSFNLYGSHATQSSITVGSGGLTLEDSVIYLRLGAQGSRLVLDGNVTTTGTSASSIVLGNSGPGTIAVQLSSTADPVTRTFNIGGGGADLTISVPVTNGASTSAGIEKTGAGTLTLSGANTYSGGTTVTEGVLRLGANNVLADNGDVTVGGGTFDINTRTDTVGALTLTSGSVTGTTGVLTASSYDVEAGTISAALAGIDAPLTKTTGGTVTLSGSTANTYTGLTTVSGGRLALGKSNNVNAVSGDLAISGGAVTFSADQQIANDAAVTMSGASSAFNGTALSAGVYQCNETIGSLDVSGGIFQSGVGSLGWTVDGAASFTGGSGNTIFVGNSGSLASFGSLSLTDMNGASGAGNNNFSLYGNSTSRQSTITVGSGGLSLNNSTLNLRLGDYSDRLGSRLILNGDVTTSGTSATAIASSGTYGTVAVELSSTAGTHTREFNVGDSSANLSVSVPITNGQATTAGITKTGAGTLTLSGANTYTGGTTVTKGILRLGANDVLAGAVTVGGGTLDINSRTDTVDAFTLISGSVTGTAGVLTASSPYDVQSGTISAALAGTGALNKTTSGTVTLSGSTANTYSGLTTVSSGTLALGKTGGGAFSHRGNQAASWQLAVSALFSRTCQSPDL